MAQADPLTRLDNWLDSRLFGWDEFSPYPKPTNPWSVCDWLSNRLQRWKSSQRCVQGD